MKTEFSYLIKIRRYTELEDSSNDEISKRFSREYNTLYTLSQRIKGWMEMILDAMLNCPHGR